MPRERKIFTPVVIDVNEALREEPEILGTIDAQYGDYAMSQEQFVLDARNAEISAIDAQVAGLRARQKMVQIHKELARHIPEVAQNPMALVYRKNGKLMVEIPFTERTMRNMMRAQAASAEKSITEADGTNLDMFESGDEEEGNQ